MNVRRLGHLGRYDTLALAAAIWFLAKFVRYVFPPLFPTLALQYEVSNAVLGSAYTALMLVYAALQFPSGALADRLGRARVITAGAVVAAIGAFVVAGGALLDGGVDPFLVLVAGMVLIGMGTGVHKTVAVGLLSATYPSRTGRALGILDTAGTASGVVAPAAVVVALDTVGWPGIYVAAGLLGLGLAAAVWLRVPRRDAATRREEAAAAGDQSIGRYLRLLTRPRLGLFVLLTVGFAIGYNGVVAFLPLYLTDGVGLSSGFANGLFGLLFALTVVQAVTGELSDRIGELSMIGVTVVLGTVGIGLLFLPLPRLGFVAAIVIFGIGSQGYRPVRSAYFMSLIPEEVAGGTLGVVRTILMGAGAVSPAIVGFLSEYASYRAAFGFLFAAYVASTAIAVLLFVVSARHSS